MTEGTGQLVPITRPQRIAVILDDPELMFLGQLHDHIQIERNAQSMSHHDRSSFGTNSVGDSFRNSGVIAKIHIHEDRHQLILDHRGDRGGKCGSHGDDLIAGFQAAAAELGRCQRA